MGVTSICNKLGYRVEKIESVFSRLHDAPIVFDVGANEGQTARRILDEKPRAIIHCFEPHPKAFMQLQQERRVFHYNLALSSEPGTIRLYEYENDSGLSSSCASRYKKTALFDEVKCSTVRDMQRVLEIKKIDLLKIDVQGSELSVLMGADLRHIQFVLIECIFSGAYDTNPWDACCYLHKRGFNCVQFDNVNHENGVLSHCDMLFEAK